MIAGCNWRPSLLSDAKAWLRFGLGTRPRSSGRSGISLIETMVFSSILLLLMGSIVMVLQGGMRYLRLGAAYQDAHRETLTGMRIMVEGLRKGNPFHMYPTLVDDGTGKGSEFVMFMSPELDDPEEDWTYQGTDLQYHRWVSYYLDPGRQELVESQLPIAGAPVTTLTEPPFPNLSAFRPPGNRNARVISRGVTDLRFLPGIGTQQVRIVLSCSVATGTDRFTTVSSQSLVLMPNR